jgi:hypothetical protein
MSIKQKEYTLSDGSVWTANKLANRLKLTPTACRYRLDQSNDRDLVMRSIHKNKAKKKYTCKQFELSDGSSMSAEEIAKRFDINTSTMYARLLRGIRDVDELAKKPTQGIKGKPSGYVRLENQPKAIKDYMLQRNYFDEMSRLFLMTA